MSEKGNSETVIPVSDCEICSRLAEHQTSFTKYGAPDMDQPLPPETARLERIGRGGTYDSDNHHFKRCPVCGMFYSYDWSYEYFVNGSEDEEVLVRLTPDQARRFLTDGEYATRTESMLRWLNHDHPQTRSHAGKCIVVHWLERGNVEMIEPVLLHRDRDVVTGALDYLRRLEKDRLKLLKTEKLIQAIEGLIRSVDGEVAKLAGYLKALVESAC